MRSNACGIAFGFLTLTILLPGRTSPAARDADLVVVADLANVSSATQWQVYLNGGAIAQLSFVT